MPALADQPDFLFQCRVLPQRGGQQEASGGVELDVPATLTLSYTDALVEDWGLDEERELGVAARDASGTWRWSPAIIDARSNTAVAQIDAPAEAWAVAPSWMTRPWQRPAVAGAEFESGERNALVIHGWNDEPWSACMLQLAAGVAPAYDNVAAVAYPSALDIRESAVWLRAEIERRWRGVPFDIIAFSEGGLVARAAVEPHAWNGDALIAADIERVIMIATPHEGILSSAAISLLNDDAARQMRPGSDFLRELNRDPRHDGIAYHLIAGDTGARHDGVVSSGSALGRNALRSVSRTTLRLPHSGASEDARHLPCDEAVYDAISH